MKFGELSIRNFLTIGDATINLMNRGLLGVQGENEDDTSSTSNGAGKSTLGDALSWAIYGVTARGASGDSVVNNVAGKDCYVTVLIHDGDDTYVVTRYRKHSAHKNSLIVSQIIAGSYHFLTQGTEKLTQAVIDKIIGCSYEVFTAAIYAGQEKMPDLPSLTDKNLKVLVEEAAGTTVLDAAYEEAKRRFNLASAQQAAAQNAHRDAMNRCDVIDAKLTGVRDARDIWACDNAESIEKHRVEAKRLIGVLEALKKDPRLAEKPTLEAELAACNAKLAAVEVEIAGERVFQQNVTDVRRVEDTKIAAAQRAVDAAWNEALRLKKNTEFLLHELKHIDGKVGTACGECTKTYSPEDLEAAAGAARARAKAERDNFNAAKALYERAKAETTSAKEAAEKAIQSAQSALEAHQRSMTDVSATSARVSEISKSLAAIADLEAKIAHGQIQAANEVGVVRKLRAEINPHEAKIAELGTAYNKANQERADRQKDVEAAQEEMALADTVAKVFSPAGVRAHILDTVTPFLNDRTAHYLGTLSDGNITAAWSTLTRTAKGELREKFKIDVQNTKGGKEFTLISGGEKRKVRLACALALQDLVAQRATKPIDLFIGDEIDDALDDAGLERLMAVLEEKARERGTVIIISHRSLRDWIRECVTVTKRGGQSVVSEAV